MVAVDIDGTLGDYHGHFIKFAEGYLGHGRNGINYAGRERFRDWFCKVYGIDLTTFRDIKLAYRQGAQKRTMPIYHYASRFMQRLHEAGAEVWITTTRPYLRLDNVDPDTRFWLDFHEIEYEGLIYDKYKYRILAARVDPDRVVAVVEDLHEKVQEAEQHFGTDKVFWRRNVYNAGVIAPVGAGCADLERLAGVIETNIQKWKELHR